MSCCFYWAEFPGFLGPLGLPNYDFLFCFLFNSGKVCVRPRLHSARSRPTFTSLQVGQWWPRSVGAAKWWLGGVRVQGMLLLPSHFSKDIQPKLWESGRFHTCLVKRPERHKVFHQGHKWFDWGLEVWQVFTCFDWGAEENSQNNPWFDAPGDQAQVPIFSIEAGVTSSPSRSVFLWGLSIGSLFLYCPFARFECDCSVLFNPVTFFWCSSIWAKLRHYFVFCARCECIYQARFIGVAKSIYFATVK